MTLKTAACQASLSFTVSQSLLKFISTESMMPSNHLILYCPLLFPPSRFPSIMKVKVAQSCPTLCNPMDYTVHGILQARILEWVASPFSRGSSQRRDWTQVSCIACGFFTSWATREALPSIIAVTRSYNFMLPCELPWLISFSLTTASLSWEHLQCLVFPSVKSQDLPDGWLRWDYGKLFLRT